MAWTKTGTVAVTTGSAIVTGAGTSWIAMTTAGEGFLGPDGKVYEILSVDLNTQITLAGVYLGATQAGQSYSILPTQAYILSLANQVSALISSYAAVKDNAGAGKFPAGTQSVPGMRFVSDDNTGLRSTGPDAMALVAGGVDRLIIDAAGIHGAMTSSTVDATPIGQTAPAVGGFTTLSATGNVVAGKNNIGGAGYSTNLAENGNITNLFASGAGGSILLGAIYGVSNGLQIDVSAGNLHTYTFRSGALEVMKLDSSGNLALGAGPSVWGSNCIALQVSGAALSRDNNADAQMNLSNNAYRENGSVWKYAASFSAVRYEQGFTAGTHTWFTAPSGTAGNPITFTQAMTLDAGGNLLVGLNSGAFSQVSKANPNNYAFGVTNSSATSPYGLQIYNSAITNSAGQFLVCCDSSANRFLVLGNGNVQNVNNSYGAISDIKLKENIADTTPKLAKLLRVRVVNYVLKTDPTHKQLGVIAQELEEISPGLIEETPDYIDVEVEPARTDVKTSQRQKVEQRDDVRYETTLVDGQWRKLPVCVTVDVPLFEYHPLFDETGAALMEVAEPEQPEVLDADGQVTTPFKPAVYRQSVHRAPVMEDVQETVDVPAKVERQATGEVTKSVKYSVFVPMLIKSMQEQQAMIDALTQRLDALEAA